MSSNTNNTNDPEKSKLRWFMEKILIPILVALIAAYATLVASKALPNPFESLNPTTSNTSAGLSSLQGNWVGTATHKTNTIASDPFPVSMKFGDCQLGKVCGTYKLEKVNSDPCTGNIMFNSIDGDRLLLLAQNKALSCGQAQSEYLEFLDTNTLLFVSDGNDGEIRGELHRSK